MAAAWMSHLNVKTRIIDKRNAKIFCGQADGLQCRSLEIFDSLGFADRAWKEANHMIEVCDDSMTVCPIIHKSGRYACGYVSDPWPDFSFPTGLKMNARIRELMGLFDARIVYLIR